MAAWLPIVKTAIPIIAEIVTVARPMFTKKPADGNRDPVTTRQIEELQLAATQNSDSVKELAEQVQKTFAALESAAIEVDKKLTMQRRLTWAAMVFGFAGFLLSLSLLVNG